MNELAERAERFCSASPTQTCFAHRRHIGAATPTTDISFDLWAWGMVITTSMIRMDRHSVNGEAASQTEKTEKNHGNLAVRASTDNSCHSGPLAFRAPVFGSFQASQS